MSWYAANAVYAFHVGVLCYLLAGWLSPKPWLYCYIAFFPIVAALWYLTGSCFLTKLENRLRGCPSDQLFVPRVVRSLGFDVNDATVTKLAYVVPAVLCGVAIVRALFW